MSNIPKKKKEALGSPNQNSTKNGYYPKGDGEASGDQNVRMRDTKTNGAAR